ncbi:SPOR domain-containing protein [Zavarzinia compransoris]|nr:SPOR domain-containing protein [Zavarzinia marina]
MVDDQGRPGVSTLPVPTTTPEERTAAAAAPVGEVTARPLEPPPGARGTGGVPAAPKPTPAPTPVHTVPSTPPPAVVTQGAARPTAIYIQAGAFLNVAYAERLRAKLSRYGRSFITRATVDGQLFYRVRVGPLRDVNEADIVLDQIIASGETGARILVE